MEKKENDINKLITWTEVSRILCGTPKTLYSGRIPKMHRAAMEEYIAFLRQWVEKYAKK